MGIAKAEDRSQETEWGSGDRLLGISKINPPNFWRVKVQNAKLQIEI